ncbi:transporter substrate-binding domain-containing protein [Paenibacillus sp. GCM10023252]|uniref:transporter substrate-binding domain-containing protein n=1 Tax=Paenibacillus sp. GCM10023252 TaxID=3252649 RepID=UPI0036068C46
MRKSLLLLLAVMLVTVLAACGAKKEDNQGAGDGNTSGAGASKKTIVLGTSADYAPYEFHKKIDGKDQIVGFDIEIAKEIAKDMGAKLEIQDMKFDGLLLALNADKVDMVISGMTPTEDRKKNVDFSDIYYMAKQAVMVKADNKAGLKTDEDLKGKKIGVQKGSIQEGIAKEIQGAKLTSLSKITELVLELKSGRVDAIIVELPVAEQYAKKGDYSIPFNVNVEEGGSAIAIKKGNSEVLESVNKTLKRLKEDGLIDRFVVEANELVE